jgi:hypothetical protein
MAKSTKASKKGSAKKMAIKVDVRRSKVSKKIALTAKHVGLNAGADAVASAVVVALDAVGQQGNILMDVAVAAAKAYRGADVSEVDLQYIANEVARMKNWDEATAKQGRSRVRKIVRQYKRIPEAMAMYKKTNPEFAWHVGMKLVTCLSKKINNKPVSIASAVKAMRTQTTAKINAAKKIKSLLKSIANVETQSPTLIAFRKALAGLIKNHKVVCE